MHEAITYIIATPWNKIEIVPYGEKTLELDRIWLSFLHFLDKPFNFLNVNLWIFTMEKDTHLCDCCEGYMKWEWNIASFITLQALSILIFNLIAIVKILLDIRYIFFF